MMQLRDGCEKLSFSKVSFCRPSRASLRTEARRCRRRARSYSIDFFFPWIFPRKKGRSRAAEQSCAGRTFGGRELGSGCPPRGGRQGRKGGTAGAAPQRERAAGGPAPRQRSGRGRRAHKGAGGARGRPAGGCGHRVPGLPAGPAPPARGRTRGRGPSSHAQLPPTPRRAGKGPIPAAILAPGLPLPIAPVPAPGCASAPTPSFPAPAAPTRRRPLRGASSPGPAVREETEQRVPCFSSRCCHPPSLLP